MITIPVTLGTILLLLGFIGAISNIGGSIVGITEATRKPPPYVWIWIGSSCVAMILGLILWQLGL